MNQEQCQDFLETEVLIVGGGPVGLALAIELGLQGRQCVLVERNDRVGYAPRAKTTNVRTREFLRRWGIADRLAAASPFGIYYPSNVVFATRLAGHELTRFSNAFYCSPVRDDRFAEHAQWIPQYKVEEVLRSRAAELPGVSLHFSTHLDDFSQDAEVVNALLSDAVSGRQIRVRAKYLVGADGARSTVRAQLGVKMEGVSPLSHNHNIIFRAPGLALKHRLGPAVMYWLINDEAPATLAPLDNDDRWTFGCARLEDPDADPAVLIQAALGVDIDIEILSRDEWTAHQLIAAQYRRGRVFLAGDACHLHPPYGGHGMNMGIGDSVDLGWKLSAVLCGWGGSRLLDSYEIERRQMHRRVIDEAVANHAYKSRDLIAENIEAQGPIGDSVRSEIAGIISRHKRREFDSLNIVLGGCYVHSPILAMEEPDPENIEFSSVYEPSAQPGCRAPHMWLTEGKSPGASLFDHFRKDGFTLLVTSHAAAATAPQVLKAAQQLDIPLTILTLALPELHDLYQCDFALIRPDQHVAWRGNAAQPACDALERIAGRLPSTAICPAAST